MYGSYRFVINQEEAIQEVANVVTHTSARPFSREDVASACLHYRELALLCACAFMMSPLGNMLKDGTYQPRVRTSLRNEVVKLVPVATVQNNWLLPAPQKEVEQWWGYDMGIMVITELATSAIGDIIALMPDLKMALAAPQLYTIIPLKIESMGTPNLFSFVLRVSPPAGARLLT